MIVVVHFDPDNNEAEHEFPFMPQVGHYLAWESHQFTVVKVGFVDRSGSMVPAIWATDANPKSVWDDPNYKLRMA